MAVQTKPAAYRMSQRILHWVVVAGVIIQIGMHDPIVAVTEALDAGASPRAVDVTFAWVHVGVGSTILLAVLARLFLRFRYGAPGHAPGTPPLQAKMATVIHRVLYALLLGMVVTGMLTWNRIAPLGGVHFYLNVALFFLILGHAGAAIYNHFIRKDGTLNRMLLTRNDN